ncbi:MAG: alpha/beta fold hydrolase [Gammaproteobacteria bacterium]
MNEGRVEFAGARGHKLSGRLATPAGRKASSWVLFAHCFTCTKNSLAAARITRALAERGFGVLRFDFTGLGESEGDFADTDFSGNVADLLAAARWLGEHHGDVELLVGHSLGGAAVLEAARSLDTVRAVATLGAPSSPRHLLRILDSSREEILAEGSAEVDLGGRTFRVGRQLLEDLEAHPLPESVEELDCALLVLHSPVDTVVGIENASEIFRHARHPKSFVSLDRAGHLLTGKADAAYAADVIAAWASRYLPDKVAEGTADSEGAVRAELEPGSFLTEMNVAGHNLVSDEPPSAGGDGQGPSPYDLLAAALASCTAMTLRLYLEHKKWEFTSVGVEVRHEKIHAADCADCATKKGKVDRFTRRLAVAGDLDADQRARLVDIAGKCPVHRTLESEIRVETELVEAAGEAASSDG